MKLTAAIISDKELEGILKDLSDPKMVRRVVRKSINNALNPIVKKARSTAPKNSGQLKKAIGKKVSTSKDKQKLTGIVGAKGMKVTDENGKVTNAKRYLHLVSNGHINRDGSFAKGNPFLKKAAESEIGSSKGKFADKAKIEVDKEIQKIKMKNKGKR